MRGECMNNNSLRPEDTRVRIEADLINCIGYRRSGNQDNCCINGYFIPLEEINSNVECTIKHLRKTHLCGVFDGVGSDQAGEMASLAAAHYFASLPQNDLACWRDSMDAVRAACEGANAHVISYAGGSATTMVLLAIAEGGAVTVHLGDSRAYLLRGGQLRLLTRDDVTDPEQGDAPRSHCITRYLGAPAEQQLWQPADSVFTPLEIRDVFLLCSDGLTDMLDEKQIQQILVTGSEEPHDQAVALMKAALNAGGCDNITALLVRIAGIER